MAKNPVPKIGRRGKSGYQDRPFKPSKKLLKSLGLTQEQFERRRAQQAAQRFKRFQAGKAAQHVYKSPILQESIYEAARTFAPEVVFGKPRNWFEQYQEKLKRLGDLVASGEYQGQFLGVGDLPEGNLLDKLAILSNLFTVDTASEILDTSENLIEKALQGGILNRLEQAELNEQYYHLVRDRDLQDEYQVNIDHLEKLAAILRESIKDIDDADSAIIFRNAIADGDIDLDKLEKSYTLFKNLSRAQTGRIFDAWVENQNGGLGTSRPFDLDEMFDAFDSDGMDFWDIEDSEFWAWFRELFY